MQVELVGSKLKIKYFLYEIVHHCNLNCKYCDHCSPIAEQEFVDLKQYKNDLKKIRKTFNIIQSMGIMGGEPLLHPKFLEILKISRKILPYTALLIFTNGICLKDKDDKFWKLCGKLGVNIVITKYKLDINYKEYEEKALSYHVPLFYENRNKLKDEFNKIKFDLSGQMDKVDSHNNCYHAQFCPTLENGILYKCPIIPASRHFNKYFNKNMIITVSDGINLYNKNSKEAILKYFKEPLLFCRYCDVKERNNAKKWEISKKDIKEWT